MNIEKDTVITIQNEGDFKILGRTLFMKRDYYLAQQIGEGARFPKDRRVILYEEQEDDFEFEDEEDIDETNICLGFVENKRLEKLLWEIFSEQQ